MTTFTTEDREQAYEHEASTVIVDSGTSTIKTLGAYINLENRLEMYRKQIAELNNEVLRLRKKLAEAEEND
jgi:lipid II:glycine glycyltransferase (peptidoglycan interpeptide bridge formation enzyme)